MPPSTPQSSDVQAAAKPTGGSLVIGRHKLPNRVVLAPMAGVTDLPFRELCLELGVGMAVAEMLTSDLSLTESRKSSLRRQRGQREGIRSVQIVGSDPQQLADAARFNADDGADIIDINMGCPAKKVCKKAAGSALLADEALVADILSAVVSAVDIPVTLKIRTGTTPEHRNGVRIARIAEDAGIQMLAVHGRTRADRFKGQAEYDTIADIVSSVTIPVLANGDITSAAKARQVLEHTGAAGVMIGRAAQGQPWLPGMIAAELTGRRATAPALEDQLALIQRHLSGLHDFYGEFMGIRIARKHIGWFLDALFTDAVDADMPLADTLFTDLPTADASIDFSDSAFDGASISDASHSDRGNGRDTSARYWKSQFNALEDADAQHHLLSEVAEVLSSGTQFAPINHKFSGATLAA